MNTHRCQGPDHRGPDRAGYTAAIYAARANLKPLLVTGLQAAVSSQSRRMSRTTPAFAEPVQGPCS